MSETAQYVDLATVDRLAQKVTGLVQILERTRQELAEARSDNERLNGGPLHMTPRQPGLDR